LDYEEREEKLNRRLSSLKAELSEKDLQHKSSVSEARAWKEEMAQTQATLAGTTKDAPDPEHLACREGSRAVARGYYTTPTNDAAGGYTEQATQQPVMNPYASRGAMGASSRGDGGGNSRGSESGGRLDWRLDSYRSQQEASPAPVRGLGRGMHRSGMRHAAAEHCYDEGRVGRGYTSPTSSPNDRGPASSERAQSRQQTKGSIGGSTILPPTNEQVGQRMKGLNSVVARMSGLLSDSEELVAHCDGVAARRGPPPG